MFFQQDGAPAHNAIIAIRRHLDQIFPNRWIGTFGVILWPARSPDLTPLDLFLWGYLKTGLCRSTCQSSGLKKQNTSSM